MEQIRTVGTQFGPITYTLTRKHIRNWNLRVQDGQVFLSAPTRISSLQADLFIQSRADWLYVTISKQLQAVRKQPENLPRAQCMRVLSAALERMLPLVTPLGVAPPELRLRVMRSQWGNCHYEQGYITLNTSLAGCPESLQDYVVLHELIHFLHHDHGADFKAELTRLMPDWKTRRKQLKTYIP